MATAFVTAFSTPPAADTCAPTFQGLSTRSRNVVSSGTLAFDVDVCNELEDAASFIIELIINSLITIINHDPGIPELSDTLTFFDRGSGPSDLSSASTSIRVLDFRV